MMSKSLEGDGQTMPWGKEHVHTIDLVFEEPDGGFTLAVVGPDNWTGSSDEQDLLRHKIDVYLEYIQSGDLAKMFPQSEGKPLRVQLGSFSPIPSATRTTIDNLANQLRLEYDIEVFITDL